MNKTIKLRDNEFLHAFIGDRGLRVYKHPVNGRLGLTGLCKLVKQATGHEPGRDEAYAFYTKNNNVVKILTKDDKSVSAMEFYDEQAKEMKALFVELGLIK